MMELEDEQDLRMEEAAERRLRNQLARHPHPQDPDHPFDDEEE